MELNNVNPKKSLQYIADGMLKGNAPVTPTAPISQSEQTSTAPTPLTTSTPTPLPPKPEASDAITIQPLRTYEQDIRNAVVKQNVSVVQMALAQSKKNEVQEEIIENSSPTSKKNLIIIGASLFLILLGVGAGGYALYYVAQNQTPGNTTIEQIGNDISADTSARILLKGPNKRELSVALINLEKQPYDKIIQTILLQGKDSQNADGSVNINSTSTLSTVDFLSVLESRIPPSLARSLDSNYTIGLYGPDRIPFIILKTRSYDTAYAGTFDWEPYMKDDFRNIIFQSELEGTLTSATSTFQDIVVNNKDARVVKNTNDVPLLLYGFADKEYLVITRSEAALKEVFERIKLKKLVR